MAKAREVLLFQEYPFLAELLLQNQFCIQSCVGGHTIHRQESLQSNQLTTITPSGDLKFRSDDNTAGPDIFGFFNLDNNTRTFNSFRIRDELNTRDGGLTVDATMKPNLPIPCHFSSIFSQHFVAFSPFKLRYPNRIPQL
uniref:Uncharacterized protein n=2 Tax=Meloidogyne TaxID=189290 RepID=A0A6V7WN78_MELEN|nr:unnamed protein product [Meloidogyne enterolobii]